MSPITGGVLNVPNVLDAVILRNNDGFGSLLGLTLHRPYNTRGRVINKPMEAGDRGIDHDLY